MKIVYDSMESQLSSVKGTLELKDAEMIRMSHENSSLEKTIIQQNIELDHLRHYDSKDIRTDSIVEKELENSKRLLETLTHKIEILENQGSIPDKNNIKAQTQSAEQENSKSYDSLIDEIETLKQEKAELINMISGLKNLTQVKCSCHKIFLISVGKEALQNIRNSKSNVESQISSPAETKAVEDWTIVNGKDIETKSNYTASIATEEALEKLQDRFRRTMQVM